VEREVRKNFLVAVVAGNAGTIAISIMMAMASLMGMPKMEFVL